MSKYSICDVSLGEHRADGKMRLAFGKMIQESPVVADQQQGQPSIIAWRDLVGPFLHLCLSIVSGSWLWMPIK